MQFLEMRVAKAWNIVPPSRFYELSAVDRAIMVAVVQDSEAMAAYEALVQQREQANHMRNLETPSARSSRAWRDEANER